MRLRRALDRGSVTEALSAACELQFVGLAEALELTLLLVEDEPAKYERAAGRWHVRFTEEIPHVELRESLAVIALLAAIPANRLAAAALAISRRRSCERIAEALVRWSRVPKDSGLPRRAPTAVGARPRRVRSGRANADRGATARVYAFEQRSLVTL